MVHLGQKNAVTANVRSDSPPSGGKATKSGPKSAPQTTVLPIVNTKSEATATLYSDEPHAYNQVAAPGRKHATVCHSRKGYARNDDNDGFCEVHCNTCDGIWICRCVRVGLQSQRALKPRYLSVHNP